MTDYGAEVPAPWQRRVLADLAASACPEAGEADGTAEWDEWYRFHGSEFGEPWITGDFYDMLGGQMRRAFLAGWSARDAVERRKAADDLTALTEELGLYDDGGSRG